MFETYKSSAYPKQTCLNTRTDREFVFTQHMELQRNSFDTRTKLAVELFLKQDKATLES